MNKTLKIILIVIGVLILLFIIAKLAGGDKKDISVKVEQAENRTVLEEVSASGKIQPEVEVKIISEVSGQVVQLGVKEGEKVTEGQLLLEINPDLYQSALNRTDAALLTARSSLATSRARLAQSEVQRKVARTNWERNDKLFKQGVISQADFDNSTQMLESAEADFLAAEQGVKSSQFSIQSAQATRKEANDNLKRTRIFAPQDGTVTALSVEQGDVILGTGMMQGTEIMRISNLSSMEVNVEVNEADIIKVEMGDTAKVEVDAHPDMEFVGIVTEIANTAMNAGNMLGASDQVTNFLVKIRVLPSSYSDLVESKTENYSPFRPGMSATVDIKTDKKEGVLTIPLQAVTTRSDTVEYKTFAERMEAEEEKENSTDIEPFTCVFMKNGDKAKLREVEIGLQDNKYVEIKSGLASGDEIIVGPFEAISRKLKNGSEIKLNSSRKDNEEKE